MIITNQDTPVSQNFVMSEFYSNSPDRPEEHYFDERLIQAVQFLRTWSGQPIRITSTYRTLAHNTAIGGARLSQHMKGKAVDFQWIDNNRYWLKKLHAEMDNNGYVKQELSKMNIRGFGYYDTFAHLDTRTDTAGRPIPYGQWQHWGDSMADESPTTTYQDIQNIWEAIQEDGAVNVVLDETLGFWNEYKWYIVSAVVLIVAWFLYFKKL